jgi:hypothetical protein
MRIVGRVDKANSAYFGSLARATSARSAVGRAAGFEVQEEQLNPGYDFERS